MSRMFDETTPHRYVQAFGPQRVEHDFIRAAARVSAAASDLTDVLMRLQEGIAVSPPEPDNALSRLMAELPALYVAAETLGEMLRAAGMPGRPFSPDEPTFTALRTAELATMERQTRNAEASAKYPAMPHCPPGTPLYNKKEILDLACTMAARNAQQKEEPQ